jgi:methylated-DNA-protein-cysteine methyltransferase-like protein
VNSDPRSPGRAKRGASERYARIYRVVRRIPRGRVATYGQVAGLASLPGCARQVGYALHALAGDSDVPWQRVVNAGGAISLRGASDAARMQRRLLEAEGLRFDARGRLDLARVQWRPRVSARRRETLA